MCMAKGVRQTKRGKEMGFSAGDFRYSTGVLRCATCDGAGTISLNVQFPPEKSLPNHTHQKPGKDASFPG